jgi:glycosyltransferase involved in cell wall biosynthesis
MHKLIIDATLLRDRLTGIERYTLEVTKALVEQAVEIDCSVLLLLAHESTNQEFAKLNKLPCTIVKSPFRSRLLTDQIWIPIVLARNVSKTCFFPGFPPGLAVRFFSRKHQIVRTVYDAVMWRLPETLSWKNKLYMRPFETFGLAYYDTIFTISDFSKRELSYFFPGVGNRIFNTSIGIDYQKYYPPSIESINFIRNKFNLPEHYFLFIGTLEPRKNLPFLLEVFYHLKDRHPELRLLLVGRLGWGRKIVDETINKLGLATQVRILGSVKDADLFSILRASEGLLFPSLYEGFGLPVIEAMACGVPVIASNTSSIPEAAGEAAMLLSPTDKYAWSNAIVKIVSDDTLRQKMKEEGFRQAMKFDWHNVAKRILKIL